MGSLPLEEMEISGPCNGNVLNFLRTWSKPDMEWFMDATSARSLELMREPMQNAAGKQVPFYSPRNLVVATALDDVPLVQSNVSAEADGDALTVVEPSLSEFLALTLCGDLAKCMKQSLILGKIATTLTAEGICERLQRTLGDGPKRILEEL